MTDSQIFSLTENISSDINISEEQNTQNQTIMVLKIDLSDILRTNAENMRWAYALGRSSLNSTSAFVPPPPQYNCKSKIYTGIFDAAAYGVYDDNDKLQKSKQYWHSNNVESQEFASYDEALHFAKAGIASLKGINEKDVPPMKTSVNWRQKI